MWERELKNAQVAMKAAARFLGRAGGFG